MQEFNSLRDYLDYVEGKKLLQRILDADTKLEVGALTEIIALSNSPRVLLFDKIKGYPEGFRIATNLYLLQSLQAAVFDMPEDLSGLELVRIWRKRSNEIRPIAPREVKTGPITENVIKGEEIDIMKFPVPLWHEEDPARFFGTGDIVLTKDPEGDWINLGVYRCQVHDSKTLGLNIAPTHHGKIILDKYWSRGESMPIVVLGGQDPYMYAAACARLQWGRSELEYACGLKKSPIDMIIEKTTGLPIPATAEIAVIGHVPPNELRKEGPFGECKGYYAGGGPRPVIKIDEIWHRNDPILQGSPTMYGSAMRHALGAQMDTSARIWDSVEREVANVKGVYALYQQCQTGAEIIAVSLKQSYAGHWKHAALAAIASKGGIVYNKMVVAVDEDIDPSNMEEVMWAIMTRCNPAKDIEFVQDIPTHAGDPELSPEMRAKGDLTSSTMIVNACKPYDWINQYPKTNRVSNELKRAMMDKWRHVIESER